MNVYILIKDHSSILGEGGLIKIVLIFSPVSLLRSVQNDGTTETDIILELS